MKISLPRLCACAALVVATVWCPGNRAFAQPNQDVIPSLGAPTELKAPPPAPKRVGGGETSSEAVPQELLASIQKQHSADLYQAKRRGEGERAHYIFHNEQQRFDSRISKRGWEMGSVGIFQDGASNDAVSRWTWSYSLTHLVRGKTIAAITETTLREHDGRIEILHPQAVCEWYRNFPAGLAQGFDITTRPFESEKGELILRGDVVTGLEIPNPTSTSISFTKKGASIFQYAGLKVTDATNKPVPAWLGFTHTNKGGTLDIHIEDKGATYPLRVE